MQKWIDENHIFLYVTHKERKSAVAQRFVRTLKGKNYIHADYFALTEEIESGLQSIKIFLAKIIPEEIFVIVSVFKTNS